MSTQQSIAFIGLGVMGAPMAAHLARAGHRVTGYNRSAARGQQWLTRFGAELPSLTLAPTPADAAAGADLVMCCVGADEDLAEVTIGPKGVLETMSAGSVLVDHTTVSPRMARMLASEAAARSVMALDAPISGGQAGAENGALAIMCGGEAEAFARARSAMAAYGANIVHVGPAGAGQTTKMANQMCIAGTLAGLAEAIRLAQGAGLDTDAVLQAISGGAAQSWQMDNRWQTMAKGEFDFGFAIDWMRKDLGYALGEARRLGQSTPVTALVDQFYSEIAARGGGREDTSALISRLPIGEARKDAADAPSTQAGEHGA